MDVAYWIVAGLLAAFYTDAGTRKLTRSQDKLRPMMGWVDTVPMPLVRAVGGLEVLGAIGLILPPLTGIAVGLSLAAAIGFVLLQIGGVIVHLRRDEARQIPLNIGLVVIAAVVAWLSTTWF